VAATAAVAALERAGVAFRVLSYDHDPAAPSYGREAAAALGLDPARVHKTLVVDVDGRLVVAVVPVTGELDLKALAAAVAGKRAALAAGAAAARATGYVVGGISPLGLKRKLPVVIDSGALAFDLVYVSAGRRGWELELAPGDLVRAAGASLAPIGR
jgi:Cys-tRNA(Pro)/Cys-tRNA(Cys) deacylase